MLIFFSEKSAPIFKEVGHVSRIVTAEENFPIQPGDIDASGLFEAFDHRKTEVSAGWIIRFLQAVGRGWQPFTFEEINAFYRQRHPCHEFTFNRLVEPEMLRPEMAPPSLVRACAGNHDSLVPAGGGWIVLGEDGQYGVTEDFIRRCHGSSPAIARAAAATAS
jgi:hypothetical protein